MTQEMLMTSPIMILTAILVMSSGETGISCFDSKVTSHVPDLAVASGFSKADKERFESSMPHV